MNEGQAYANDVVPRARGMASRLIEEANGYNTEVIQKSEGDASRFKSVLSEYAKAPGVTRDRLYIDMMQSVLGNTTKVLIDQKAGGESPLPSPRQAHSAKYRGGGVADTRYAVSHGAAGHGAVA